MEDTLLVAVKLSI